MRVTKLVPIRNIVMDRYPINPSTLSLIQHLEGGGTVPPIKIYRLASGQFQIKDGRHRITAFKLLGRENIKAVYSTKVSCIRKYTSVYTWAIKEGKNECKNGQLKFQ